MWGECLPTLAHTTHLILYIINVPPGKSSHTSIPLFFFFFFFSASMLRYVVCIYISLAPHFDGEFAGWNPFSQSNFSQASSIAKFSILTHRRMDLLLVSAAGRHLCQICDQNYYSIIVLCHLNRFCHASWIVISENVMAPNSIMPNPNP